MFTDTHCHLFKCYYENIDEIIKEANDVNVKRIIVAATNIDESKEVIKLASIYENIYYCLGIHPEFYMEDFNKLEVLVEEVKDDSKFVAIGEIGLDFYYDKNHKREQQQIFEKQLELAIKYDLPVVIHNREATGVIIDILKNYKVKGVFHCFNGSIETANILIDRGFYIGVGGVMTFKNSKVDEVIKKIPLEKLVLETDSPYLTPEPFRGRQNAPKYVSTIAEYLANIKNITIEEVSLVTEANVKDIFDI